MNRRVIRGLILLAVLILVLGAFHLAFVLSENASLDKWTKPARPGQFDIAIRVDWGDWWEMKRAADEVYTVIPQDLTTCGEGSVYQKWRGSGYWRICLKVSDNTSLQDLANKCGKAVRSYVKSRKPGGRCRVCVVDANGTVYWPEEPQE